MEIYLGSRGRITIPASVRRRLGIEEGTYLHFELDDNAKEIILAPTKRANARKVKGMFKESSAMQMLLDEKKRERDL